MITNPTTATPVQVDTELADLYGQQQRAEQKMQAAALNLHYALGERPRHVTHNRRTIKEWPTTDQEALTACRARGTDTIPLVAGDNNTYAHRVRAYDDAATALVDIEIRMAVLDLEHERRRWTRFFTVQAHGGHVHSSMNCSTCNRLGRATLFGWNPELSGLSEAEAVAKLGPYLCTVCFPTAPVEWTRGDGRKRKTR